MHRRRLENHDRMGGRAGQKYGISWKIGTQRILLLQAEQVKNKTKAEHRIKVGCSDKRLDR